jgi:mannose-6-phosphate isomerase-like protein (cupin superfamily)
MFKRNWDEIIPREEYKGTAFIRDYFRRRDKPELEGGFKITQYLEWVRHTTVTSNGGIAYHRTNVEEILYILQGEGVLKISDKLFEISPGNVIYIPSNAPHSIRSKIPHQPLIFLEYGVRDPVDSDIQIELLTNEEKGHYNAIIDRWMNKDYVPNHNDTCWSWPTLQKKSMKYLLFATMMSVPDKLSYHRHNSEAIYFIDSGRGYVTVAGEEVLVRPGDAIYMPSEVPHMCRTILKEQPLNVFCVGVATPYNTDVWVENGLPYKTI